MHKGERLDLSSYLWPEEFNPMSGIINEATGMRWVSPAYGEEPVILANDGKPGPARDRHAGAARRHGVADPSVAAPALVAVRRNHAQRYR